MNFQVPQDHVRKDEGYPTRMEWTYEEPTS